MEKLLIDAPKAGVVVRILTAIRARRFVTTKQGRIGMCPGNVQKGDSVYVFKGI